jgi:hypothetical protein
MLVPEGHGWSESLRRDYCSPAYGHRELATVVNFGFVGELPKDFATLLIAGESPQSDPGRLVRIGESSREGVCGYHYSNSQQEHSFFFAHGDRSNGWALGGWASDADFLYWSSDRKREQYMLVLCNGSYADVGGHRVLTCGGRVSYAEVLTMAAKVAIFSSDSEQIVLQRPLHQVGKDGDLNLR